MGEQVIQPQEDFKAILARQFAELEEERKEEDGVWSLVREGQAHVNTEQEANLVGKLLIQAEEEVDRVKALADARVARARGKCERLRFIFEKALADWTIKRLDGRKVRSLILDDVQLGTRKVPAKVETESPDSLAKWAEVECLEAVTYVPRVSIEIVKQWEDHNKKLAPGRVAREAGSMFYFKIPKGKESDHDDQGSNPE